MDRIRVAPRASFSLVLSAIIIAAAILVSTVYVTSGASPDATYYACLRGGSLSQVATTPQTCSGGEMISWNSAGSSIADVQLSEGLLQAIKCGAYPHWGVDLSGCDLTGATMERAGLWHANLSGTKLKFANLYQAAFYQADLTNADLVGTVLTQADFTEADLTGATLLNAIADGATFTNATLCRTIMPTGEVNNSSCP